MADNYLEKKFEELHSGRLNGGRTGRRTPMKTPIGKILVPFSPQRVFVTDGISDLAQTIMSEFVKTASKVAFSLTGDYVDTLRLGAQIAQRTGSRFYPYDSVRSVDVLTQDWGGVDVFIDIDAEAKRVRVKNLAKSTSNEIVYTDTTAAMQIAGLCLYLSMPMSGFIDGCKIDADSL